MQLGPHEIADQDVVEEAVFDRRHQRVLRHVEADAAQLGLIPALGLGHDPDAPALTADDEVEIVEMLAQRLVARDEFGETLPLAVVQAFATSRHPPWRW